MSTATETPKTGRAAVAALLNDQPAKNGAQLVKALALSGTPGVRLQPARDALAAAHIVAQVPTVCPLTGAPGVGFGAGFHSPSSYFRCQSRA